MYYCICLNFSFDEFCKKLKTFLFSLHIFNISKGHSAILRCFLWTVLIQWACFSWCKILKESEWYQVKALAHSTWKLLSLFFKSKFFLYSFVLWVGGVDLSLLCFCAFSLSFLQLTQINLLQENGWRERHSSIFLTVGMIKKKKKTPRTKDKLCITCRMCVVVLKRFSWKQYTMESLRHPPTLQHTQESLVSYFKPWHFL